MNAYPRRSRIRTALLALILFAAAVFAFEATRPYRSDNFLDRFIDRLIGRDFIESELPTVENGDITYVEMPADSDLDGLLYVTGERESYGDGEMTLIVPALGLKAAVSDGTTRADLSKGPSLFEYSNMPGEGDRNVSIAGHRSRGMFYDLDKPGEGDRAHIVYGENIYTYVFLDRKVVLPTDWSVITNQGFSCCTLVTCTPVRVADKRMVVRFELEKIEPYSAAKIKEYAGEAS